MTAVMEKKQEDCGDGAGCWDRPWGLMDFVQTENDGGYSRDAHSQQREVTKGHAGGGVRGVVVVTGIEMLPCVDEEAVEAAEGG